MGHIQKRTDAKNRTRWQARYRGPDGREHTRRFDRKADAETWLAQNEVSRVGGTWTDPRAGQQLFVDYAAAWLAGVRRQPGTLANIEGRLRGVRPGEEPGRVVATFGQMPMATIRPVHVRQWVANLTDELAPSTVRSYYFTLHQLFETAAIDGVIPRSPCIGIDLPPERARRENMVFLDALQVARLADAITPRYRALILTAAFTGLRWGELVALLEDRIDLDRGTIDVREALADVKGHISRKATKTYARRTVTMPTFLVDVVRDHLELYPSDRGLVFSSAEGTELRRRNFRRRHYLPATATAELPPGLRFHDLRHTHAALLIAQGAHAQEIKERLGHSSIKVTFDRYGHLLPSLEQRLVAGLDATWAGVTAATESDAA